MSRVVDVRISDEVLEKVPDLFVKTKIVEGITIESSSQKLQNRKTQILEKWKGKMQKDLDSVPEIIAYRNLQAKFGADPKQMLPAVEGMLVRGIFNKKFPTINSAVDATNIASLEGLIPVGLFDFDMIEGDIELTVSHQGDEFVPLGKSSPEKIKPNTPVLRDSNKIFSAVGSRDSKDTMITPNSRNLLLFSWGTSEISEEKVSEVLDKCADLIRLK
jgi:DNA/RNA-binding domain of Phe-tRNA-synthetase-like protein